MTLWTTVRLTAPVLRSGEATADTKLKDSPKACESITEPKPSSSPGNQESVRQQSLCAPVDQVAAPLIPAVTCRASTGANGDSVFKPPKDSDGSLKLCKPHQEGRELSGNGIQNAIELSC